MQGCLYHSLKAPWPKTDWCVRVCKTKYGTRIPISHVARALGLHKDDALYVMKQEGIKKVPYTGYREGGILLQDIGKFLKSALLELNWTNEQIEQALEQLETNGQENDTGARHFTGPYRWHGPVVRFREEEEDLQSLANAALGAKKAKTV